ncbi:hypothetical protein HGRIS_011059 [Hohenbuehelia grisea]|uniref:Uncharacterized protein n=1 Tax=Hohenbuehelia grisea TaxID=104357 RepID=A0ABR3IZ46_9AGAR
MSIEPGSYHLRASPADGVGGMYATSKGYEKPIVTAAQVQSEIDEQKWRVIQLDGSAGLYEIRLDTIIAPVMIQGWGTKGRVQPDEIILLSGEPMKVRITPSHTGGEGCFVISPDADWVGTRLVIGTEGNHLVIQDFPIDPTDDEKLPYWKFYKA